jgi:hypothetical protein
LLALARRVTRGRRLSSRVDLTGARSTYR